MDRPNRKLAVAVHRLDQWLPSGRTLAAGAHWKFTLVSSRSRAGNGMPLSTTWWYTPSRAV